MRFSNTEWQQRNKSNSDNKCKLGKEKGIADK